MLGQPNLNVKVNRERAARYGLNAGDISNVVQAALGGVSATTLLEADRQFSVTVRLAPEYRSAVDSVRSIKVGYQTPSGANAYVPLSELADISLDTGASRSSLCNGRSCRSNQRSRTRSREHSRGGAGANCPTCEVADRLPHYLGRRIRGTTAGRSAFGDHRAHQPVQPLFVSTGCWIFCDSLMARPDPFAAAASWHSFLAPIQHIAVGFVSMSSVLR